MKIYIAGVVGLILLIFLLKGSQSKPISWEQRYFIDTTNPYDLYVFNAEIKNFIAAKSIEREWHSSYEHLQKENPRTNYLFIDKSYHNFSDTLLLNEVASKGSNLFISCENIYDVFLDTLKVRYADFDSDNELNSSSTTNYLELSLTNKSWGTKSYVLEPVNNSFSFVHFDPNTTTILGFEKKFNGESCPNFIRIKFGKGYVYLHNQPQVFTNLALLNDTSSAEYVAHILSYLPKDIPLCWFVDGQTINYGNAEKTPLSIVFQYPALRMAWLIMIYGLFLFILFNVKRKQRIIPVVEPLRNTTVEFVQTIGNLYFQEDNATKIVDQKITYFLDKIRTRYYLDTSNLDDKFIQKLQLKSGKPQELIEKIVRFIILFRKGGSATANDLVKLNDLIERFWKKDE